MSAAWTGEFVRAAPGRVVEMVDHDGAVRRRWPLLGWLAAVDGDEVAAEPVALDADGSSLVSPHATPAAWSG